MIKPGTKNYKKQNRFLFPALTRRYLLRLVIVGIIAYVLFGYVLIPLIIDGKSMEPTYTDGSFNFCFRLQYVFSEPRRGDVVAVRFSGKRIMLLKRVIALEGDTVEFRNGQLYLNGKLAIEPYVLYPGDWDLPPRKVKKDHVYVVGDNRNVPMGQHDFGQTRVRRIMGSPLW